MANWKEITFPLPQFFIGNGNILILNVTLQTRWANCIKGFS